MRSVATCHDELQQQTEHFEGHSQLSRNRNIKGIKCFVQQMLTRSPFLFYHPNTFSRLESAVELGFREPVENSLQDKKAAKLFFGGGGVVGGLGALEQHPSLEESIENLRPLFHLKLGLQAGAIPLVFISVLNPCLSSVLMTPPSFTLFYFVSPILSHFIPHFFNNHLSG